MSTFTDADSAVAKDIAGACLRHFTVGSAVHPGTLIGATARMAGTYLFRSFPLDAPGLLPGMAVLSVNADDQASNLIRIAASVVAACGSTLDHSQAAQPTDQKNQPRQSFLETQRTLEPVCRALTDRDGMSDHKAAQATAVATGILVHQCARWLDVNEGFRIACFGIVEGAKTAPDPVRIQGATAA